MEEFLIRLIVSHTAFSFRLRRFDGNFTFLLLNEPFVYLSEKSGGRYALLCGDFYYVSKDSRPLKKKNRRERKEEDEFSFGEQLRP